MVPDEWQSLIQNDSKFISDSNEAIDKLFPNVLYFLKTENIHTTTKYIYDHPLHQL